MGEARDLAERYYQLFAARDFDGATALFTDDCITLTPIGALDNAAHLAFSQAFKNALPDARMELIRAVEAGDEVHITARFKGTHSGDLVSPQGTIPASGNQMDLFFADYFRVSNGKIAAHEIIWDQVAMLAQLGALPSR